MAFIPVDFTSTDKKREDNKKKRRETRLSAAQYAHSPNLKFTLYWNTLTVGYCSVFVVLQCVKVISGKDHNIVAYKL